MLSIGGAEEYGWHVSRQERRADDGTEGQGKSGFAVEKKQKDLGRWKWSSLHVESGANVPTDPPATWMDNTSKREGLLCCSERMVKVARPEAVHNVKVEQNFGSYLIRTEKQYLDSKDPENAKNRDHISGE